MKVQELSKTRAAQLQGLGIKKMREKKHLFAAEGAKCVADTLGHFPLHSLVATKEWWNIACHDSRLCRFLNNPAFADHLFMADAATITRLSSLSTPPGVIAFYSLPTPASVPEAPLPANVYLMLDGVRDPGNMGTILRTAHWFGVNNIFASADCVDIYNPKTVQSTMGSISKVNLIYCNLCDVINANPHIPAVTLMLEGENLFTTTLPDSAFFIMGNESNGVSDELTSLVSRRLTIPPAHPDSHPESLNVAIASAITLAQFFSKNK